MTIPKGTGPERRAPRLRELSGWGRHPIVRGYELVSENLEQITRNVTLSRGLGRSYGDASLPPPNGEHVVANTSAADRLLSFDPETGVLRAEAGLSLATVNRLFVERGWFPPASPGTQSVTLGGLVAADVHGKGHHREGCFGHHLTAVKMRVADGRILEASKENEPDLFRATIGGMGLTGHILEVEFHLQRIASPWIWAESEKQPDLHRVIDALQKASAEWPYTLAWIDLMNGAGRRGRGILEKGRWATVAEAPPKNPEWKAPFDFPIDLPSWALNGMLVRSANLARYLVLGNASRGRIVHPASFFYPLDIVGRWNRLYGRRGFTQYQCVLPLSNGCASVDRFFTAVERLNAEPYLCVLKDFAGEGAGMISFPKRGLSIVMDMPIREGLTQKVVDGLNELVSAEGGRVYLAKDALTRAEHYRAMEPRLDDWLAVRRKWDPEGALRSAMSVRLFGDEG